MEELGPSLLNTLQELIVSFPRIPTARRDLVREDSPLLNGYGLNFVLQTLQNCGLVYLDVTEVLHVTVFGQELAKCSQVEINREIILLLVENYRPTWAKLLPRGRRECLPNLPTRVAQCLTEAGLGDAPATDNIRGWWQRASRLARYIGNNIAGEVGDKGEEYSLRLERERVGLEPKHISLETTWAGYDILSFVESGSDDLLRIEVKASTQKKSEAHFFLTRNEWTVAKTTDNYLFHLWLLSDEVCPRIARVEVAEVKGHVPENQGAGKWETTKIPFRLFRFEEIKGWGVKENGAQ